MEKDVEVNVLLTWKTPISMNAFNCTLFMSSTVTFNPSLLQQNKAFWKAKSNVNNDKLFVL